jgi:hypothetical protein
MATRKLKLKAVLFYESPFGDVPLAEVNEEGLLAQIKECILETAEAELKVVMRLDPILRIDKETELHRKVKILNRLLPTKLAHTPASVNHEI